MTSTLPAAVGSGLRSLFAPRGITVVGASRNVGRLGTAMVRLLSGFADTGGHLALVNGRDETMYGSVTEADRYGPVDLAVFCVPAAACAYVLAESAVARAGAVVICGGGFAEAGGPGIDHQRLRRTPRGRDGQMDGRVPVRFSGAPPTPRVSGSR
jgi:acetyltransferase